jgi:hypothetical protein
VVVGVAAEARDKEAVRMAVGGWYVRSVTEKESTTIDASGRKPRNVSPMRSG